MQWGTRKKAVQQGLKMHKRTEILEETTIQQPPKKAVHFLISHIGVWSCTFFCWGKELVL